MSERDLAREDAFLSRKPVALALIRENWHPLHAARVDLASLDEALAQLKAVLLGEAVYDPSQADETGLQEGDEAPAGTDAPPELMLLSENEADTIPPEALVPPKPRNKPPISKPGRKRGWRSKSAP